MTGRHHLPLLLLSLAIALAIKVAVHEGEQLAEQTLAGVRVLYHTPDGVLLLDPVQTVQVRLRGQASEMAQLNPLTVDVEAEVPAGQLGFVEINLSPDDVRTQADLEIISVEPSRFSIEVERELVTTLPIQVQVSGEPAAGAEVSEVVLRPDQAEVSGPESLLRNITNLVVHVSVERRAISFEERLQVPSPDPSIRIVQPRRVVVFVRMREPQLDIGSGAAAGSAQ